MSSDPDYIFRVAREAAESANKRPIIAILPDNTIEHSIHGKIRIVLSKNKICIGCTDITPEAAKFIVSKWSEKYGNQLPEEVIIQ